MKLYVIWTKPCLRRFCFNMHSYIWTRGIVHINMILCQSSMTQEVHKRINKCCFLQLITLLALQRKCISFLASKHCTRWWCIFTWAHVVLLAHSPRAAWYANAILHSTLPVTAVLVAVTVTDCELMFCRCVPTTLWQETQFCAQSSSSLSSPGYHK